MISRLTAPLPPCPVAPQSCLTPCPPLHMMERGDA